ncbi:MAG: SUMF1/EgtB/PvdO family nonheme iron enzyme [Verrucomicrobiae bacterium]|nr:SUMF1/EgtB/PvdO family nonheme iron enzyme [Verrucomicrobiae bacterium]
MAYTIIVFDCDTESLNRHVNILAGHRAYQTLPAQNLAQLNYQLQSATVSLVIADIYSPEIGGGDLVAALRGTYPTLPILFVTAYDSTQILNDARCAGLTILPKPIEPERLLRHVGRQLGLVVEDVTKSGVMKNPFNVAQPQAMPAAQPQAQAAPRAMPAAQPQAQAAPRAVPAAQPQAQAAPRAMPAAQPQAQAAPRAVPAAQPQAQAAPRAVPAAQPQAQAAPRAVPAAPAMGGAVPKAIPAAPITGNPGHRAVAEPKFDIAQPEPPAGPGGITSILKKQEEQERQGFSGQIEQFHLVDIIQMCCISGRTGKIIIARGNHSGAIFIKKGAIVHAISGVMQGEDAVYEIVSWTSGSFKFIDGEQSTEKTIQIGWEGLIMEAVRLRDEKTGHEQQEQEAPSKDLSGKVLGPYKIARLISDEEETQLYEATQSAVNRKVALRVLSAERSSNPSLVQSFLGLAATKAKLQHPNIGSVFEAGEAGGRHYYAQEFLQGESLQKISNEGRSLENLKILKVYSSVLDALSFLQRSQIPHQMVEEKHIYIDKNGVVKIMNPATLHADQGLNNNVEINALAVALTRILKNAKEPVDPEIQSTVARSVIIGEGGYSSFAALQQDIKRIEARLNPAMAIPISKNDQAAMQEAEAENQRRKKVFVMTLVTLPLALLLTAACVWWFMFRGDKSAGAHIPSPPPMVEIPAGDFVFQNGENVSLPTYWISKYPVTIWQYKLFLDDTRGRDNSTYQAPELKGKSKDNTPKQWAAMIGSIKERKPFPPGKEILTWDHPVFNIDYLDAHAYAKWLGYRLPTEQEWEKAARGTKGSIYPWGNETDPKRSNSGADFSYEKDKGGEIDGFVRSAPVDQFANDVSEFGVVGMGGNVSSWTATWGPSAKLSIVKVPIIRGSNWATSDASTLTRDNTLRENQSSDYVGLRVVSDTAPAPK